ncbi:MAG: hypothetical protein JW909_02630 [Planctomycetes bacterium]|nr:hypothetical protein [Planctomycetota bacterium]
MRILMYIAAFMVLGLGMTAAVLKFQDRVPIAESHFNLLEGIVTTVLWTLGFLGLAGLYGTVRRLSGADTDPRSRRRSRGTGTPENDPPTTRKEALPGTEQSGSSDPDDQFFTVTPLDQT